MRLTILFTLAISAAAVGAQAQTAAAQPGATDQPPYYAQVVAHSAFGNVTSQSYGFEFGAQWKPSVDVFLDVGHIRDAATSALSSGAQKMAGALTVLQPAAVTYSAKQPITFVDLGLRYRIQTEGKIHPYVLGGGGIARVNNNVVFQVGGSESAVSQYVTVGTDLSGSITKPMVEAGAGVVVPVHGNIVADLQYRFSRVIDGDASIVTNRVGLGLGFRF